jgi:hypothetical protein
LLYIYALLGAEPREIPGVGICGAAVRAVRCGQLFAAVSEIPARPETQEPVLREHDQTVRQLAEFTDAILPARFGSVVDGEDSLEELLKEREPELLRALTLVAGCEQMTLRVYGEVPAIAPPVEEPSLGPGARYLAGKLREKTVPGLDSIRPALSSFIRAEHVQHHGTPPLLASVYHLIERGQSAAYRAALHQDDSLPVRFAASGPWPPYAFGRWENS